MAWKPAHIARMLILLASSGLLSGCTGAYLWTLNRAAPPRDAVEQHTYDARNSLALDVYRPAAPAANGAPVIVFFHGGSWQNGNRHGYRFVGQALAKGGVLALVPDYRKAPRHKFPDFMFDAADAVAWARAHARELGGDPDRIYLLGHSAGAHIAVLLATDRRYLEGVGLSPRMLRGVIALSGPYDFLPSTEPLLQVVFGKGPQPASQPLNFVDGDEPPFLVLHGDADNFVDVSSSRELAASLLGQHEPVDFRVVPGVGHVAMIKGFLSAKYSPALADTLRYVALSAPPVDRRAIATAGAAAPGHARGAPQR